MKTDIRKAKEHIPGELDYTSEIKSNSEGKVEGIEIKEDKTFYLKQIHEAIKDLVLDETLTQKDINTKADNIYDLLFYEKKRKKSLTPKEIFDHLERLSNAYRELYFTLEEVPSEVIKKISQKSFDDQKKSVFDFAMAISSAKQKNSYFIETIKMLMDAVKDKDLGTEAEAIQIIQKIRIYKGKKKNEYSEFLSNQLGDIYFFLTKKKPRRISVNQYIEKDSDYKAMGTIEKGEYHDFLKKIFAIGGLKLSAASKAKSSAKNFKDMEL